jgi:hypothetical protein
MPYPAGQAVQPAAVPSQATVPQSTAKKVADAWWLVSIFLFLPGGLIAWAVVRKDNPKTAGRMLIVSLTLSVFLIFVIVNNALK